MTNNVKGFGKESSPKISKKRMGQLKMVADHLHNHFYPDGIPPNVYIKIWKDEFEQLVCANVTDHPEYWDLPNYIHGGLKNLEKFKSLESSIKESKDIEWTKFHPVFT